MTRQEENARKVMMEHAYGMEMWQRDQDATQDTGYRLWGDLVLAGCVVLAWGVAGWYFVNHYTF